MRKREKREIKPRKEPTGQIVLQNNLPRNKANIPTNSKAVSAMRKEAAVMV
jgi:hypothetical protein